MRQVLIEWDGTNVPEELRELPPGQYVVTDTFVDDSDMSEEEEAAVMEGLADLEAGRVVPYEVAMRELRSKLRT